jgi:hypothetical protein
MISKIQAVFSVLQEWILYFLDQQLEIACTAACKIQEIESAYMRYQDTPHLTHDQFQTLKLYFDSIHEQSLEKAEQSLLQFERALWLRKEPKRISFQSKLEHIEGTLWKISRSTKGFHPRKASSLTIDEPIGLIPRSIARTFSRLQTELDPQPESLLTQEFKLIRFQAIASFQFINHLILIPWICQNLLKTFFFEPVLSYWWNTGQREFFLNSFQEQKALEELQKLEDTAWLDLLMTYSFEVPFSLFINTIHERALQLVANYNNSSIQALVQVCTDGVFICTLFLLLAFSKKKLSLAQMRSV